MISEDMNKIFAMDSEGRFVNLIIPELDGMPELNLIGKTKAELNSEEVTRLKIFVRELRGKTQEE